jgi:hypothetical protein
MSIRTKPKSQLKKDIHNKCGYTVLELKSMAKKRGLKGYSTMRKADLCVLLDIIDTPNVKSPKKLNTPHSEAPTSILKKRPTEALIPVTLHITQSPRSKNTEHIKNMEHTKHTEIMVYIKPCDRYKLVFPCNIKSCVFMDQHIYDDYKKSYTDREEYARIANIELEKEKKELRAKRKSPKKIKFNI